MFCENVLYFSFVFFFFFKQKTAYEIRLSLVGSEMCIRDSSNVTYWLSPPLPYHGLSTSPSPEFVIFLLLKLPPKGGTRFRRMQVFSMKTWCREPCAGSWHGAAKSTIYTTEWRP